MEENMKIKEVTNEFILFNNGSKITFAPTKEYCNDNYADFTQLDELALAYEFDENTMKFETVDQYGFRFGSENSHMFFVPCYSDLDGYYSSDVDIYYNLNNASHVSFP